MSSPSPEPTKGQQKQEVSSFYGQFGDFAPTPEPPRAQLRPQRGSSAKPDPGVGVSLGCPWGVPAVPSPWIVPTGAWLSYGNAAGREGDPRDPRGALGCSLQVFLGGIGEFWGNQSILG